MEGPGETQGGDPAPQAEENVPSGTATNDDFGTVQPANAGDEAELFPPDEREELERKWADIQARFVDDPRGSVEEANALVAELMERLVSSFSEQRAGLEQQWERGEDVTTEELRIAFQRYRSFFGRLLALGGDR